MCAPHAGELCVHVPHVHLSGVCMFVCVSHAGELCVCVTCIGLGVYVCERCMCVCVPALHVYVCAVCVCVRGGAIVPHEYMELCLHA